MSELQLEVIKVVFSFCVWFLVFVSVFSICGSFVIDLTMFREFKRNKKNYINYFLDRNEEVFLKYLYDNKEKKDVS